MKVMLLAGGFGTRLSEETDVRPKPMVEIGGMPVLWHIMKTYSSYGFNDFVILLGYKGHYIKEFFANYFLHQSDITINMTSGKMEVLSNASEPWTVTLIDTGLHTMTGGRIKKAQKHIGEETFLLTYGDGLSDVNISELVKFHKSHGKILTMTSVMPEGRFGALTIQDDNRVLSFDEKPRGDNRFINGGYFVCDHKIFNYINDDAEVFEQIPMKKLAEEGEIFSYKHYGFWKPMDSLKDKNDLNNIWDSNNVPWKTWE
jgi:glucose-1-phosphate cytidylyltransferase